MEEGESRSSIGIEGLGSGLEEGGSRDLKSVDAVDPLRGNDLSCICSGEDRCTGGKALDCFRPKGGLPDD